MRKLYPALAACALIATPASAQLVGGGLVVVNVSDVIDDIAVAINVEENTIPVNVQVPVAVAAAVCDIDVNVLAQQRKDGQRSCTAETTNSALNKFVQKTMRKE